MLSHFVWTLVWVLARGLFVLACAMIAFLAVNAIQQHLLPIPTSIDTGFARLGIALAITGVACFAAAALASLFGASQFTPAERILQSLVALALAATLMLIWIRR
jgi:hypothetical protein